MFITAQAKIEGRIPLWAVWLHNGNGSLGIGGEVPRFWGVSGVYTPLTPQNLALTTANPKEPRELNGNPEE